MKLSYTIQPNDHYENVKDVLKGYFGVSDRLLLKLKNNKKIYKNNKIVAVYEEVSPGDSIYFLLDFIEDNSNIVPTYMDLDILYEDDAYLVVNKPADIAIHPSMLHYTTSLANGIRYYFDSIGLSKKIRPINRLDKDTSGIVIFAKNEYVQESLIKQMKQNIFQKQYIAFLEGNLSSKQGTIDAPIARKEGSIIERCIHVTGDHAISHYTVLASCERLCVIQYSLETGRTHQLRVHSQYIGHSILGDTLYGNSSTLIARQALHSYKISFMHPITHKKVLYKAPIPTDMVQALSSIGLSFSAY